MATTAQLNIRMKPELKAAGDSVLNLYGISPTDLVRALCEKVSLGEKALTQVVEALVADPAVGSDSTLTHPHKGQSISMAIRQRQECFEQALGLDPSTYVPLERDELDDLVYQDYLEERQACDAG